MAIWPRVNLKTNLVSYEIIYDILCYKNIFPIENFLVRTRRIEHLDKRLFYRQK